MIVLTFVSETADGVSNYKIFGAQRRGVLQESCASWRGFNEARRLRSKHYPDEPFDSKPIKSLLLTARSHPNHDAPRFFEVRSVLFLKNSRLVCCRVEERTSSEEQREHYWWRC
jgi:hypothetical protein